MPEDIYRWIDRETCPYMREAYAGTCLMLLEEWQEDEEHRLRYDVREVAELELRKIIRYAQTDQIAEERLAAELGVKDNPATRDASLTERMNQMELRMGQMSQEIAELKARHQTQEAGHHWPMFTAKATEEEKKTFEDYLRRICLSKKRNMTTEIKKYLALKERDGIIQRPTQTNQEYEWIKSFGYSRSEKTYYNAN